MKRRSVYEIAGGANALLLAGPRSARDICRALGMPDETNASAIQRLNRYLDILHDRGVIYVHGWVQTNGRSLYYEVWGWQPSLFERDDAPHPVR